MTVFQGKQKLSRPDTWHPHLAREERQRKKSRQDALHNVLSLRLSDEEKEQLTRLLGSSSKTVSEILREALALWMAERRAASP